MKMVRLESLIQNNFKGITPSYVDNGSIIVLNQKCIRNNTIDYSFARFHNPIKEFSNKKVVQVGDILINSTGVGTAGRCAFVRELPENKTVITDSHILTIRIADFYQAGCIEYLLFGMEKILQTYMDGSTGQGEFDKQRLYNIEIPEFKKPKFIYDFLTNLENKITLNNQINTQLEHMAKTLYDYWFVQFDFPNQDGKPYKSSGGKMVYNETLKREIPEGWEVGCIGDYCKSTGGYAFKSNEWKSEGNPVIKIKNILENQTLDILQMDFVESRTIDDKFKAVAGNVVIAMTGATIGKFAIVPKFDKTIYINQRVGYFDLGENPVKRLPFFINSLNMSYVRDNIFNVASGASQPNISNEQINKIPLLISKNHIIDDFNKICEKFYSLILNNNFSNKKVIQLRDFLLPMLMNGQVEVGDD